MTETVLSADWAGRDAESLLWLASYPRSGNTFTRILLANYFSGQDHAFNLNNLQDFIPGDGSRAVWGEAADDPYLAESIEAVWKARPAMFADYRKRKGYQPLSALKTHTANAIALGTSGFDIRENDRAIYIVRHPLDVLLSLAGFNGRTIEETIKFMTWAGFVIRGDKGGHMEFRGSWTEHVTSWLTARSCPLLLVRYAELCTDTDKILREILAFLGIPIIDERVRHAVAASRFEKLREQEARSDFNERPREAERFFREGRPLQWLTQLAPEHAHRLADACEEVMALLGFTHPRDVLPDGSNALRPIRLSA